MNALPTKPSAVVLTLTGALLLTGCLGEGPSQPNQPETPQSFLVFISDRNVNAAIHRVNLDGTRLRQVTGTQGAEGAPDCSADGSRLVFTSMGRDGPQRDIFRLGASGELNRLTIRQGTGQEDYSPAWAPDGERIAFITSGRGQFDGAENRVAIMTDDGTVVEGVGEDARGVSVDWSPGGQGLAVASEGPEPDGDLDLFRVDLDGNVTVLADDPDASETDPAWSGSGTRVFFSRRSAGGDRSDIYSVRADGSDLQQHTSSDAMDVQPTSSPDGTRVAFASDRSGNFDIYVMDVDGTDLEQITGDPGRDDQPTWCDV